jgi:hypothetical protein
VIRSVENYVKVSIECSVENTKITFKIEISSHVSYLREMSVLTVQILMDKRNVNRK